MPAGKSEFSWEIHASRMKHRIADWPSPVKSSSWKLAFCPALASGQIPIIPVYEDLAVKTPLILLVPPLIANSLCRGKDWLTMRETEVQIQNSGSLAKGNEKS